MKKTLPIFILLLTIQICKAQFTNLNWKVGRKTSMNFTSGSVIISNIDSCKSAMDNTNTSICDRNGSIIFYSNGCRVYDRNGNVMPNGSGFNQGTYSNNYVNTDYYPLLKSATIIPFPYDSNKFYMFYENMEWNVDGGYFPEKLYYLIVDRTLNNGLGDVTIKDQTVINGDTLGGNIFAIKHGNGKDWWIIARKYKGNKFYSILIDSNGVHNNSFQVVGNGFNFQNSFEGCGSVSKNGDRICYTYGTFNSMYFKLEFLNFERCNGNITINQSVLRQNVTDTIAWIASCFSASDSFIYFNDGIKIYQSKISLNILATAKVVGINNVKFSSFFKMELAPDGKIYISPYGSYEYMSVINKPDSFGVACNFVENAIQFGNHTIGPWADGGLPNTPNFALGKINCGVGIEEQSANTKNELLIYPNPASQSIVISRQSLLNTIEVTNILGQKISFDNLRITGHGEPVEPYQLNTENLPSGIYFIKATNEKGNVLNAKFVKE